MARYNDAWTDLGHVVKLTLMPCLGDRMWYRKVWKDTFYSGSIPEQGAMTAKRHNGTLIASVKFKKADLSISNGNVQIWATYSNGAEEKLFAYYSEELSFESSELIGKSKQEALDFRRERDIAYIRAQ